jgi:hypothetical protein
MTKLAKHITQFGLQWLRKWLEVRLMPLNVSVSRRRVEITKDGLVMIETRMKFQRGAQSKP